MMVQVDLQAVNICIFENRKPVVMRHLLMDIDTNQWEKSEDHQRLQEYQGDKNDIIGPLEDIYLEIDRVRNFYNFSLNQGHKKVSKILLDGDHPWLSDIKEKFNDHFNIPVVSIDSSAMIIKDKETVPPSLHLNIGLGLKEVE